MQVHPSILRHDQLLFLSLQEIDLWTHICFLDIQVSLATHKNINYLLISPNNWIIQKLWNLITLLSDNSISIPLLKHLFDLIQILLISTLNPTKQLGLLLFKLTQKFDRLLEVFSFLNLLQVSRQIFGHLKISLVHEFVVLRDVSVWEML